MDTNAYLEKTFEGLSVANFWAMVKPYAGEALVTLIVALIIAILIVVSLQTNDLPRKDRAH